MPFKTFCFNLLCVSTLHFPAISGQTAQLCLSLFDSSKKIRFKIIYLPFFNPSNIMKLIKFIFLLLLLNHKITSMQNKLHL